jgi:hypothetical protein
MILRRIATAAVMKTHVTQSPVSLLAFRASQVALGNERERVKSTTLAPGSFIPMTGAITVQNLGAECERVIVSELVDLGTTPNFFSRVQVTMPQ